MSPRCRSPQQPSLVVDDVPSGTYYLRVRAVDDGAPSAPSVEVVVVVP